MLDIIQNADDEIYNETVPDMIEQLSEIEKMVYKPHETFEEELEALILERVDPEETD